MEHKIEKKGRKLRTKEQALIQATTLMSILLSANIHFNVEYVTYEDAITVTYFVNPAESFTIPPYLTWKTKTYMSIGRWDKFWKRMYYCRYVNVKFAW